jgi:hypothetical protein
MTCDAGPGRAAAGSLPGPSLRVPGSEGQPHQTVSVDQRGGVGIRLRQHLIVELRPYPYLDIHAGFDRIRIGADLVGGLNERLGFRLGQLRQIDVKFSRDTKATLGSRAYTDRRCHGRTLRPLDLRPGRCGAQLAGSPT